MSHLEPPPPSRRAPSQSTASPRPSRIVWAATLNGVASRGPSHSHVALTIASTTLRSMQHAGGRESELGRCRWRVGPGRCRAGGGFRQGSHCGRCREPHPALTCSAALHTTQTIHGQQTGGRPHGGTGGVAPYTSGIQDKIRYGCWVSHALLSPDTASIFLTLFLSDAARLQFRTKTTRWCLATAWPAVLNARQACTAPVGSACRSASPGSPAIATAAGGTPQTKFACIALCQRYFLSLVAKNSLANTARCSGRRTCCPRPR